MNYGAKYPENVYEWLDLLREHPLAFLGTMEEPLVKLEAMLHGYYMALRSHGKHEDVPPLDIHFIQWLSTQYSWGFSRGFAEPFREHTPPGMSPLEVFFQFVDKYRKLKPTVLLTVGLNSKHKPTGQRVRIGGERLIKRPDRISIVQYKPKRLHLLRFHYGKSIQDDSFLWKAGGKKSYSTSIAEAKKWAFDEFNILEEEWQLMI